jgi:hypothetical protein
MSGSPVVGCTGWAEIVTLKLSKVTIPINKHFLANILFLLILTENSYDILLRPHTEVPTRQINFQK